MTAKKKSAIEVKWFGVCDDCGDRLTFGTRAERDEWQRMHPKGCSWRSDILKELETVKLANQRQRGLIEHLERRNESLGEWADGWKERALAAERPWYVKLRDWFKEATHD